MDAVRIQFEKYEKKVYNEYVFENMFLPIKLNREIYTEIEEKVVCSFKFQKLHKCR